MSKSPMDVTVLVYTGRTLKMKGAAQGPFWLSLLAVVSFCPSKRKPGSVNLNNYIVN